MNTTISLIRIAALLILSCIGFALIFSEEQDINLLQFLLHVLLDKALGIGCLYTVARLYGRWSKSDKLISRFAAWNAKGSEE